LLRISEGLGAWCAVPMSSSTDMQQVHHCEDSARCVHACTTLFSCTDQDSRRPRPPLPLAQPSHSTTSSDLHEALDLPPPTGLPETRERRGVVLCAQVSGRDKNNCPLCRRKRFQSFSSRCERGPSISATSAGTYQWKETCRSSHWWSKAPRLQGVPRRPSRTHCAGS